MKPEATRTPEIKGPRTTGLWAFTGLWSGVGTGDALGATTNGTGRSQPLSET